MRWREQWCRGMTFLGLLRADTRFSVKAENQGVVVTKAGLYSRLIDSCINQLKAQGPTRTCNESKHEEEDIGLVRTGGQKGRATGSRRAVLSPSSPEIYIQGLRFSVQVSPVTLGIHRYFGYSPLVLVSTATGLALSVYGRKQQSAHNPKPHRLIRVEQL